MSCQCNGGAASAPIEVQLTSCQCNGGAASALIEVQLTSCQCNGGAARASGSGPCVILAEFAAHCEEE